jgi:hypothetical protein
MTTTKKERAKNVAALLPRSPSDGAPPLDDIDVPALVRDLGALIDGARKQVSITANAVLSALYWQIGNRIRTDVLDGRRAEYGAQIVASTVGRFHGWGVALSEPPVALKC